MDDDEWDFPVRPVAVLSSTAATPPAEPAPESAALEVRLPSARRDLSAIESFDDLPLRPQKLAASMLAAAQADDDSDDDGGDTSSGVNVATPQPSSAAGSVRSCQSEEVTDFTSSSSPVAATAAATADGGAVAAHAPAQRAVQSLRPAAAMTSSPQVSSARSRALDTDDDFDFDLSGRVRPLQSTQGGGGGRRGGGDDDEDDETLPPRRADTSARPAEGSIASAHANAVAGEDGVMLLRAPDVRRTLEAAVKEAVEKAEAAAAKRLDAALAKQAKHAAKLVSGSSLLHSSCLRS